MRQEHLNRCHDQFKAYKGATEDATSKPTVATLYMDWSENAKMWQAREEKSAYYDECQIPVHAIYGWMTDGCQSYAALSDYTDHKTAAVMTSILPVLKNFAKGGKTTINIVIDSPMLQYRNRKIFYLIHQFAEEYIVTLHWIYLEAGHGKGIPDGIGVVVK